MSAYVVDRDHIRYLVSAALYTSYRERSRSFRWYDSNGWQDLTHENASEVGQMLWNECMRSVSYRYPSDTEDQLPGPTTETFIYYHHLVGRGWIPELPQVFMSCDCYEYQSCETPDWEQSSAFAFLRSLRKSAWQLVPGYGDAEWGAPAIPSGISSGKNT
jgi:hypothetical protein